MATYIKVNDWVKNEGLAPNLLTDQFAIALSNVAPASESVNPLLDNNGILANITQISYTNLSTSRNLTVAAAAQTGGVFKLDFNDLIMTAGGSPVGPFRYIYIYDDTPTAPADPLVCCLDNGSSIQIDAGSSKTLVFHANGLYNKT